MNSKTRKKDSKIRRLLKILGPGLITGAADDDPSGIATYSQTGAQFGYGQLWTTPFLYPLMVAIQEACARIGAVTGKGIAQVIKENYSKQILYTSVAIIVVANTINIGADLGAMASAMQLIVPLPFVVLTLLFTVVTLVLQVFVSYRSYATVLKWLSLSLLVYPVTLIIINTPWSEVIKATFLPHIEFSSGFFFILAGVVGTTISPYMFFWQASEEVEEEIEEKIDSHKKTFKGFMYRMRIDTALGMFLSQLITWSIIVVAGTVLHTNGVFEINTASDAAKAILPLVDTFPNAGFWASTIFAFGIVGLGLLAVPVLASSAAYATSEAFSWHEGLYRKLRDAHGFYGVITLATLVGLLINFIGIDPIKALIITSVLNAIASIPLIYVIIKVSSNKKIMRNYTSGILSKTFLWLTFGVITLATSAMFLGMLL